MAIDAAQEIRPLSLTPVAAPVDTYVRPSVESNPGGDLKDLAGGLQALNGDLTDYFAKEKKRKDDEDAILGEAEFHKNNQQGYADAIREGKIPAQSSKAFVDAYKRTQGTVAGQDLQTKFSTAYEAWGDKENADPNAYRQFVKDFIKQNVGDTTDPEVLRGLMPKINEMASAGQARHTQDVSASLKKGFLNGGIAVADQVYKDGRTAALAAGKPIDYDRQWDKIRAIRADLIAHGATEEKADQMLADQAAASAIENRDPRALGWLDQKVPGKDYTYAQTPYGKDVKQKTIDALDVINRRNQAEDRAAAKSANDKAYDAAAKKTIESIVQDPNADLNEDVIQEGLKTDGLFRQKALGWQKEIKTDRGVSDPTGMTTITTRLMNGEGFKVIREGIENGVVRNARDISFLKELDDKYTKGGQAMEGVLKGEAAKTIMGVIGKRTATDLDISNVFHPEGLSDQGLRLQFAFKQRVMEWVIANPKATGSEQDKAVSEIGAGILATIQAGEPAQGATLKPGTPPTPFDVLPKAGDTGASPAAPAPGAPQAAPTAPSAPAPVLPQPSPAAPAQQAPQAPQQRGDMTNAQDPQQEARAWFSKLPTASQSKLEEAAANSGVSTDSLLQAHYAKLKAAGKVAPLAQPPAGDLPAPTPADKLIDKARAIFKAASSDDPNEEDPVRPEDEQRIRDAFAEVLAKPAGRTNRSDYQLAVLKDDPHASRILDFIAGPESNGNYNAYYANAGSKKDLSQMTVAQVQAWQRDRVAKGSPSSATGRYQFMSKTLAGLIKRMGIEPTEKFTPLLQDRMALELLKQRGYDKFKAGTMRTETFANNLAKEWASLPNLRTGMSHYAGDKVGNKSHVSPGQVVNVLLDHPEVKKVAKAVADGTIKLPEE